MSASTGSRRFALGIAALVVAGCVRNGAATATFPQHEGFGATGPSGTTIGTIERRGGCLMYEAAGSIGPSLLVWPADFVPAEDGNAVVAAGRLIRVGDRVRLGGGEYTDEAWVFERLVGPPVAPACRTGRYVLVTSIIEAPR